MDFPISNLGTTTIIILTIITTLLLNRKNQKKLPLGPPRNPLWGHTTLPPNPASQFTQWSKDLSTEIIYYPILTRPIIILNSLTSAHALLDKKSQNYADRPRFVLFEVMGWGVTLTFLRFGPRFKLHRRLLQQSFTPFTCRAYQYIQEEEARRAVRGIVSNSCEWENLLRQFSTAVVLRIGFGIQVQENDPYVKMAIEVEEATGQGGVPGASVVDFFPVLRFLPSGLAEIWAALRPLAHARRTRASIVNLHHRPWDAMKGLIRSGEVMQASFMGTHFGRWLDNERKGRVNGVSIEDIKGAAGAISIAGGNTTWSTVIVCVLNLMRDRGIQEKARQEIEGVVGTIYENGEMCVSRLPAFEDRPRLRYLEYVIQEATRWAPLSPLGVPHASIEDDTFQGYHIPKGSVVFANAWAMSRDERYYSCPGEFNPDRYIPQSEGGRGEPLPEGPFGFGRRVCPGQHLALAGVYIVLVTLLATMDLDCPVDEKGERIEPRVTFSNGLSGVPDSFPCIMKPRSARARELLQGV